jgi:hypothetical protein
MSSAAQQERGLARKFAPTNDEALTVKLLFMQRRISLLDSDGKRLKLDPNTPFTLCRILFSKLGKPR